MKKTIKEYLIEVKAEIDTPEKWTQGVFARDKNGEEVSALSPEATCRCVMGAVRKVSGYCTSFYGKDISTDEVMIIYSDIKEKLLSDKCSVGCRNDSSTHEEIMIWLDSIIESC